MCGFLVTNKTIDNLDYINHFIRYRGPDNTNHVIVNSITFVHNLLSMTGEFTVQPFIEEDVVCLYNGEIYNYLEFGDYPSDGCCVLPLYSEYGEKFVKLLDGEFALCIFDFKNNKIILSTDLFRTKPLFLAVNGPDFGIATYQSALVRLGFNEIQRIPANSTIVYDLGWNIVRENPVYEFDLEQTKNHYEDWNHAFESAIRKRSTGSSQKVFIGLSGGYDSGAIACELNKQGVDYIAYSVVGREKLNILKKRHKLIKSPSKGYIINATYDDYDSAHHKIVECVEELKYEIYSSSSNYNEYDLALKDDNGANALSFICSLAEKDERKIYISGQGADEIFSDYGFKGKKKFKHSNFGGLFPEDLNDIFPWASFFGSSQYSYLMKEEYVSGAYGLEGRYPYLDRQVVQEFLWLSHKIKNSHYKSVLFNYLKKHGYPFKKNDKRGFMLIND